MDYIGLDIELERMRRNGEALESEHGSQCINCKNRIGIPCLVAKSCTKYDDKKKEVKNDK